MVLRQGPTVWRFLVSEVSCITAELVQDLILRSTDWNLGLSTTENRQTPSIKGYLAHTKQPPLPRTTIGPWA